MLDALREKLLFRGDRDTIHTAREWHVGVDISERFTDRVGSYRVRIATGAVALPICKYIIGDGYVRICGRRYAQKRTSVHTTTLGNFEHGVEDPSFYLTRKVIVDNSNQVEGISNCLNQIVTLAVNFIQIQPH